MKRITLSTNKEHFSRQLSLLELNHPYDNHFMSINSSIYPYLRIENQVDYFVECSHNTSCCFHRSGSRFLDVETCGQKTVSVHGCQGWVCCKYAKKIIFCQVITSALCRGYVIDGVKPSISLLVSLFVNSITQKHIDGFSSNFHTLFTYA